VIFDVTLPLRQGMVVWPGDPDVTIERSEEGGFFVSRLCMGTHSGTHIDPPKHIDQGKPGADSLPLDVLLGGSYLADMSGADRVTAAGLEGAGIPRKVRRLLLKTDNSSWLGRERSFRRDFVALSEDAAEWIISRGIELVGIDGYSIEPYDGSGAVHHLLLEAGVVVLENLLLKDVPDGWYELLCLPLKLLDGDGAPARVVLRRT
jgi:arylformamidase